MALHFSNDEFDRRQAACRAELAARDLDALLIFKQESMYYLTGYDTSGYLYFQAMVFGVDGSVVLVTRSGDGASAERTSIVKDIRIWIDRPDANPTNEIRDVLADAGLRGRRIGVEYGALGLTAARG